MNILFLTLISFDSIQERNIYTDLLREFVKNGHNVYAISPVEKRQNQKTHIIREERVEILRLLIGNIQKTNIVEKGFSTILIEPTFKKAIRTYFSDVSFDLVLYSTPPITLVSAIEFVKKRDNAKSYLLLKDIFPQNAVDIGMISKFGIKGLLYRHFRRQEKKLYAVSDRIGCMSQANVDYVIKHNPEVDPSIVEVCPNSVDVIDKSVNNDIKKQIRSKYEIPLDKKVFIYGGNLGKPQGIPFLIECIEKCSDIENAYFLVVGDGTEFGLIKDYVINSCQSNIKLLKWLPKEDYDSVVGACDVGMIFLDYRFTIPNFPSRLLSYMQAKIPVLACTDNNTDIGRVIVDGGFGWWCASNDAESFRNTIDLILKHHSQEYGDRGFDYLLQNYNTCICKDIILRQFDNENN